MQNIHLEMSEVSSNQDPIDISKFYADYDLMGFEFEEDKEEDNDNDNNNGNEPDYETHTVKQLTRICDYYKIPKLKKKNDIIDEIIVFEANLENIDIVIRRTKLWGYITELKSDSYMKQFIFWS
jgi:hypothetical protein